MNSVIEKYITQGQALLQAAQDKQAAALAAEIAAEAIKRQAFVSAVLKAAAVTIPADLLEFLEVGDHYTDFPWLTLRLPDCDEIRFSIAKYDGKLLSPYRAPGEPYDWHEDGESGVSRDNGGEGEENLLIAIATAHRRFAKEAMLRRAISVE